MQLKRRHKYILLALGIYWPLLFWLTHIPVPQIAAQSGMSDKTMHVLAYLVLVFFVWLAIKPYQKVEWNKPSVWAVLAVVVLYGVADELIQARVGRMAEVADFMADLFGAVVGLSILSVISFWPALLSLSAIFIFVISNLSRLTHLYPEYYFNTVFHFTAYTAFTLIWIQHLYRQEVKTYSAGRLAGAVGFPLGLLVLVKVTGTLFFNKAFWWVDVATAVFGMAAAVLISYFTIRASRIVKE